MIASADRSLAGKLRRRASRLRARRPLAAAPGAPRITFSFDDAPRSAATTGADVLASEGARGVFFVCSGLFGADGPMGPYADAADVRRLHAAGHEIGCHTASHLNCGTASAYAVRTDCERNAEALERLGVTPTAFAYPFGEVSVEAKRSLAKRYAALRAIHPGLVGPGSDLNQLPAVGIEGDAGEARALAWMERAQAEGRWLVLYTHDVRDRPSPWGCTPSTLRTLLRAARAKGFEITGLTRGATP